MTQSPPANIKSKSEIRLGFFEMLFGDTVGFLCIATTNPKSTRTTFTERFFEWPREAIKAENYILKQEANLNVYFGVNLLRERERKKKNCLPTDIVWADLDNANPDKLKLPPPIVSQTSPGRWQAFWRLTSRMEAYDAERYSRRLAYSVGADISGWDLTQLFRVPLTRNFKYHPAHPIALERALEVRVEPVLFEEAIPAPPEEGPLLERAVPSAIDTSEELISRYATRMDMDRFTSLYTFEPAEDDDWSKLLWTLEVLCFRAGMSADEVFIIVKESACNKYARDGRPVEHLWREVLKCAESFGNLPAEKELLTMPQFVGEPASETFIDLYKEWACEATDAVGEFHELSAFIVLSSLMGSSLRLEANYGSIAPNLWGLVLGDSTVTRKSTSMKMAMDLLSTLEPELILATDGSVEGLLTGLATRPNKVSVFFRDEVSGLFDSINKREYLSSMPETLAHLYDVPQVYSRLLRKEVIRLESPAFIFFGGGITERVYSNISEEWIESGFMPRFLIVAGEFDQSAMRPTGPPTALGIKKRLHIVDKLADLKEHYSSEIAVKIGTESLMMPPRIMAKMTPDAWTRYQAIEGELTVKGYESLVRNTALPTFERLARSIMKMSMLLAASRQVPVNETIQVEESDVINAAWYAQKWGAHSVELILNAGKAPREKYIDRVYRKITNNPGILRSTMMQHLHMTKREMDEVMGTLEERGQIRKEQAGRGWRYWTV